MIVRGNRLAVRSRAPCAARTHASKFDLTLSRSRFGYLELDLSDDARS